MDQNAFESYKSRTKAALANQEANPQIALSDSLQKAMYMNHPRALRVKADMIDKIDYKRIMEMYKDRFKDAGDFTFLFVGNITLDEAKPLIETYLGGLPTIHRTEISAIQKWISAKANTPTYSVKTGNSISQRIDNRQWQMRIHIKERCADVFPHPIIG